jgi:phosphoribosylanthranilate isomerase
MIRIKVCGMRDPGNIREVAAKKPDIMGFIFFPGSKRFVGFDPDPQIFLSVPDDIKRAGVFVNEEVDFILKSVTDYNLHVVQLHGSESPDLCTSVRNAGYTVVKAFGMGGDFDFKKLSAYSHSCDYFLFDTYTRDHGGSGKQFDWSMLNRYNLKVPFLLSGGICDDDVLRIRELVHPMFYGVDINSRFELSPGLKDAGKIGQFINALHEKV